MRAFAVACLVLRPLALVAGLALTPAFGADAPIGGSWVATCPQASLSGFTLQAECSDPSGVLHTSTLDLLTCGQPATATNVNGRLVCESGPRRASVPGSWSDSCADERMVEHLLTAQCLDGKGGKLSTSLDLSTCAQSSAGATNMNGQLVCASGANTPATTSRVVVLNTPPPSATGSRQNQLVLLPTPDATTGASSAAPLGFAGAWSVTPDVGKPFVLVLTQAGSGISGEADIEGTPLRLSGTPVGAHLDSVWQVNAANGLITGNIAFEMSPDRNQLSGTVRVNGTFADVRHWAGVRQGAAAALPPPSGGTAIPGVMGAVSIAPDGFTSATVNRSVSVRNKPTMSGSIVIRSLPQGTVVAVQCQKSWCALSTGDGFVSKSFLNLHPGAASTDTAMLSNGSRVLLAPPTTANTSAPLLATGVHGCDQRAQARSDGDSNKVTLTFHNTSGGVRHLVWINGDGGEVSYATLSDGQTVNQQTFEGHVWELTDEVGRCTMLLTAGGSDQMLEVE